MGIKKAKGKFRADYSIKENGRRKRIRKNFDTRKEKLGFLAEARRSRKVNETRSALQLSTRTILEMVEYYYLLPRFKKLRPRSQTRNRELIQHLLTWCQENGITYLHEFTRETAQRYISHIMDISSGKGQQHNFIIAKMLFAEELERDNPCIQRNPFPKSSPFKNLKFKPIAMPEELINMLREQMSSSEKCIYGIMYYTGCRNGELLYLTWDQVTEDRVRYGDHQIFDKKTNEWIEWITKTANERTLWLNKQCNECFAELRKLKVDHGYVLPDECRDDAHWILRTFDKIKRRTVAAHPELQEVLFSKDKKRSITPKRFRSTFVTHIIRNTGNAEIAKVAAGHKSIQTTINHYTDDDSLDIRSGMDSLDLDKNNDKKSNND